MATITKFEEIDAWKKARVLTQHIYEITGRGHFARDFGLRDQIRRASVSSMSNIAEGFERGGNKEFIQFLSDAKASAGEVKSQLYVALDAKFIDKSQFEELYHLANETSHLIGFMRYLQTTPLRGTKFVRS
jgi:four helix bundle protein